MTAKDVIRRILRDTMTDSTSRVTKSILDDLNTRPGGVSEHESIRLTLNYYRSSIREIEDDLREAGVMLDDKGNAE